MDKISLGSPSWPETCNLLPQFSKAWDYRCMLPHLAKSSDSEEVGREKNVMGTVPKRI